MSGVQFCVINTIFLLQKKFDRHYSTFDEENYRRDIFLATLRSVREHNEWYKNKQVSYSQCINEFSDLTQDEFQNGSTMSHYGTRHVYKELSRDRSDQLDLTLDSQSENTSTGPAYQQEKSYIIKQFVKSPMHVQIVKYLQKYST